MDEQQLGRRLKELRGRAGLTQRELARRVGVNYSYVSKIEHGAVAPPGEKLIERLTSVLGADEEELTALAGRIPSDVIEILKSRGAARMPAGSLVGRVLGFFRGGQMGDAHGETGSFGAGLKDLRKSAGFTQRRVADGAGISAAYLCKLEKGSMPPPRGKVIEALADVLNVGQDELMSLAGRITPELAQMMNTREAWELVRSGRPMKNPRMNDSRGRREVDGGDDIRPQP